VIVLEEVDAAWVSALRPALESYPYRHEALRDDNFGVAVYSRLPLRAARTLMLGDAVVPTVEALITAAGRPLTVIGTHPLPPVSIQWMNLRNQQLQLLARHLAARDEPALLLGDLNITAWARAFSDFLAVSGLRETRSGFGLHPTWPSPMPGWLRIPIDHVLASEELVTRRSYVGPDVGSDHRPVVVDLYWHERPS
jgi:endonuclease/exonuclease/phosphatase (EEP) superfamily protein YafD